MIGKGREPPAIIEELRLSYPCIFPMFKQVLYNRPFFK